MSKNNSSSSTLVCLLWSTGTGGVRQWAPAKLTLIQPDMERRVHEKQAAQKLQHARERSFTIGQKVMVKNLRPGPAWIAAEITKQLGPVTFLVHVRDGQTSKRHVDHPKYYMTMACKTILQLNQMEMNFVDIMPSQDTYQQPTTTATTESTHSPSTEQQPTATTPVTSHYPTRNHHPPDRFM